MTTLTSLLSPKRLVIAAVVVVLVVAGLWIRSDSSHTSISAYFTSSTGLYVGDDVKVLGVKVGKVTSIKPEGDRVLVKMNVDSGQPIPKTAKAAIVAPTLVSGRFVQLAPVWKGGARLHDGARIGLDRTTVPVSFDEVKQELTALSTALGPGKKDKSGSLSRAIGVLDTNLKAGNGTQLRRSIASLRGAADTLSDGSSDLFTTVKNLNSFTRNLAVNDAAVRGFTRELSSVGGVLARNRTQLTSAVASLNGALHDTKGFLKTNRSTIKTSVNSANILAATLADRSNELAGVLHVAPTALGNLGNIIENQAITGRASLANLDSVAQLVCGAILGAGGTAQQCSDALQPLLQTLGLDSAASQGGATSSAAPSTRAGGSAAPSSKSTTSTLSGLLRGLGLGGDSAANASPKQSGSGLAGLLGVLR